MDNSRKNIINIVVSVLGTDPVERQFRSFIRDGLIDVNELEFRGDGIHALTTTIDCFVEGMARKVFLLGSENASKDHVEAASLQLFERYIPEPTEHISFDQAVIYVQSVIQTMRGTQSFNDMNIYHGIYLCVMGIIKQILQSCCVDILEKGDYITKVTRRINPSMFSCLKTNYTDLGLDFRTFITPPITGTVRYLTAGLIITTMDLLHLPRPMQLGKQYCSKTLGQGGWVSLNGLSREEDVQIALSQYNLIPQQFLKELLGDHPINPKLEGINSDHGVLDGDEVEGVGRDVSVLNDSHGRSDLNESSLNYNSDDDSDYDTSSFSTKNSMLDSELDLDLSQYVNDDDYVPLKEDDSSHESDGDVYQW